MSRDSGARASISINLLWLLAGRVSGDLCLFVFYVGLSRVFGQVGIGHYAFAMSTTAVLAYLADFGLHRFSIQYWSRSAEQFSTRLGEVLLLRMALVPIGLALIYLLVNVLPLSRPESLVVMVVGLHQVLFTVANGWLAAFVAHHRSRLASMLDVGAKLLTVVLGLSLIAYGASMPVVLTALPLGTLCLIIVAAITVSRRFGPPKITMSLRVAMRTAAATLPSFLSMMGRQLAIRADVILLGVLAGSAVTGIFSVGQRFIWVLISIPALAATAILPLASRLASTSREGLVALYTRSVNLAILLAIPAGVGICLIAEDIITIIFGSEFVQAIPILRILSFFLVFSAIRNVVSTFLTASNQEATRARLEWIGAIIGISLQGVLIPVYGAYGAAVATVTMEGVTMALVSGCVMLQLGASRMWHRLLMASAGSIAFTLAWALLDAPPAYFTIPLAVGIYALVLMSSPSIFRDELAGLVSLVVEGSAHVEADS